MPFNGIMRVNRNLARLLELVLSLLTNSPLPNFGVPGRESAGREPAANLAAKPVSLRRIAYGGF